MELDKAFFQTNILDKEGSPELLNQANFKDFLRGIHFSLEPTMAGEDLMMLFDLKDANITISYSYMADGETKNKDFELRFLTQRAATQQATFPVVGNAVNTFVEEAYPNEVMDDIASEDNAERIYLKGGAGGFAEIDLFDAANGREAIEQIKANDWIINEANLVFYVDYEAGAILPPRLYLFNLETGVPLVGRNDARYRPTHCRVIPFMMEFYRGTVPPGPLFDIRSRLPTISTTSSYVMPKMLN